MCMQFTLDKNPSNIFLFTTRLLLLVIPCRKVPNSAGPGAKQSATESACRSDNNTILKPCILAVSAMHIYICPPQSSLR